MAAGRPQTGGRTGASEEMDVRGSWADAAGAPGGEFMKLLTSWGLSETWSLGTVGTGVHASCRPLSVGPQWAQEQKLKSGMRTRGPCSGVTKGDMLPPATPWRDLESTMRRETSQTNGQAPFALAHV